MAAGAPIVASDLDAFARVLDDGALGRLTAVGDPVSLAAGCSALLGSPTARDELRTAARHAVARYDWSVVSRRGAAGLPDRDRRVDRPGRRGAGGRSTSCPSSAGCPAL